MKLAAYATQAWLRAAGPSLCGNLCRLLYGADNVTIGSRLRCDGVPRCLIDPGAELIIGNDVIFRSGVELRVHGKARLVIEDGARIDRDVRILAANRSLVHIGAGARIGLCSVLNGGDDICVGRKVLISGFVYLQTSMHRHSNQNIAIRDQGYDHRPISISDGAWLGAHVVVLPGIKVGADSVVGSNAVVTRNIEPRTVVAGVPAQPIYSRASAPKE